jgi:hypothetical protein
MIKALLKACGGTREAQEWRIALEMKQTNKISNNPTAQITQSMQNDPMQNYSTFGYSSLSY